MPILVTGTGDYIRSETKAKAHLGHTQPITASRVVIINGLNSALIITN